ncbi:RNA-binding protein 7 [Amphibalanus amphitrite]|uniref:RNA-binding protein 7 n=1 Tax=Amphibalanus amphitrite TaxID=1232801 RepID=A0A6A4VQ24_AMPAM|nr:RNA-binding protein 7 [Amphibalanus amphitrite]
MGCQICLLVAESVVQLCPECVDKAGPLARVSRPRDHQQQQPRPFAFITYEHEESVPYAVELFQGTALYGRALRLQAQGAQAKAKLAASSNGSAEQRSGAGGAGSRGGDYRSADHHQGRRPERYRPGDDGERPGGRRGDRYSDRAGDRYGADRYGDRGGDRYGDRYGDRSRSGDRYGDRGGDRVGERSRHGGERPDRHAGRHDYHDDRERVVYEDSYGGGGSAQRAWSDAAGRSERRRPQPRDGDGWRHRPDERPPQRRGRS